MMLGGKSWTADPVTAGKCRGDGQCCGGPATSQCQPDCQKEGDREREKHLGLRGRGRSIGKLWWQPF